jgi:uncharacterized glyoxalase superfamily protein PhnB/quinol monooxygenase YgiN
MTDAAFTPAVFYREPKSAVRWLEEAFGFTVTLAIDGPPDAPWMCHYEMSCGGRGRVMVGAEWDGWVSSPAGVGGRNTQTVHVELPDGLDEHCRRARATGAVIAAEPEDQPHGDRSYRAIDPEGHHWTFRTAIDPAVPVHLIASFRAVPGTEHEVRELIGAYRSVVLAEPGCVRFDVFTDRDDAAAFTVVETYVDQAAFDAHLSSAENATFNQALAPRVAGGGSTLQLLDRVTP